MISLTPNVRRFLGLDEPMDDPGLPGAAPAAPYDPAQDGYAPTAPINPAPVVAPPPPSPAPAPPPSYAPSDTDDAGPTGGTTWNGSGVSSAGPPNASPARGTMPTSYGTATDELGRPVSPRGTSTASTVANPPLGPAYTPPTQAEAEEDARRALDASPAVPAQPIRSRMDIAAQREQQAVGRPDPWQPGRERAQEALTPAIPAAASRAAQAGAENLIPTTPQQAGRHLTNVAAAGPLAGPLAVAIGPAIAAASAAQQAGGNEAGRRVGRALGLTDQQLFDFFGIPISGEDIAGFVGEVVTDPSNVVAGPSLTRAAGRAVQPAIQAGRELVEQGTEALGRAGRALGEEAGRQILDLTPMPSVMPRGTGGRVTPSAPERPLYRPEAPEGNVRRYHGTASVFDEVDPLRLDENGLYGPGYYTTSDPRVAGSYGDQRGMANDPEQIQASLDYARRYIAELQQKLPDMDPSGRLAQSSQAEIAHLEAAIPEWEAKLAQSKQSPSGPNVRALDLPSDLNLIDADAPLDRALLDRLQPWIERARDVNRDIGDELDFALNDLHGALDRGQPITNDALLQTIMDAGQRALGFGPGGEGRGIMTALMQRAGFDGIAHKGGQRVPMMDATGAPIEHDVSVIFPGSVNKVRNAFSGTQGGAFLPVDPASAAAGGAMGAMSEDEEGNTGDPLRTAAGLFLGAVGGTPQGKRFAQRLANQAAKNGGAATPPNLLELMQGFRFSWGMLGNFSTGLVNAAGTPVEIALGLPSEAIRMTLFHGRPAAVGYQVAEMAGGVREGIRDMLGTIAGQVPQAVRNSPDFRPPLSERMQGTAGKALGHAIDFPGRLTSQAPDAFWAPIMRRWGRAREAGNIMAENGTSALRPDEQIREMHRILNNPTPQEATRLDAAAQKWAEEMQYKGDAGYWESQINNLVRGSSSRVATAADPAAKQVHEALGSFVMPFFGTIWKLHKLAASRVPGAGFATNASLPLDEKISRQLVGAGLGLWLADYAASGMVTGPGPSDPNEAALVNKDLPPHSTYVPAVGWVPNDWFGSAGPYLNAVGGYYDARRYATEQEKADADKMGDRVARDVLRGFERFPVAQSVKQLYAMATTPTKGVTDFLANAGSSFVPAPLKTYFGSQDPLTRTTDREGGFVTQLQQKAQQRTGIMRQDLPAAQDRFGRDVPNERQGLAAFGLNVKQPQNDPVVKAFREAGVEPGFAKRELTPRIPGVTAPLPVIPLTPKEQREWNAARGRKILETVQPRLSDPKFQALTPEARKANLEAYLKAAGEYADGVIQNQIGGPDLSRRVREAQERKRVS